MRAIYRYEVPVDGVPHQRVMTRGRVLSVGLRQREVVEFWALHDDTQQDVSRLFVVVGTGHPIPATDFRYCGHAYDYGGALVWHLLEINP